MLDQFWQRLLPYQMTRIQEPDLLIDHDSGGGGEGCKHFLEGPVVEPFAYSGVNSNKIKLSSGGSFGKWFPFSHPKMKKSVEASSLSSTSLPSSALSPSLDDKPTIIVHNNNNIILDMLDENTRWSSSSSSTVKTPHHFPSCNSKNPPILPPPSSVAVQNGGLLHLGNTTKSKNFINKNHSKSSKHGKNSNSNNSINNTCVNNKNNCSSSSNNNNSSTNSCKSTTNSRINNCTTASMPSTATHINVNTSSSHQNQSGSDDEDSGARHLIIRYIHCNERPNKRQLVTLGLVSVIFLIILIILLSLFLSPTRTFVSNSVSGNSNNNYNSEISDAFISSDITSNLNKDDADLDDSDSYDDDESDVPYYSSTSSSVPNSSGLDLKKVSKLSWDLLNSNQDASSSRGSGSSSGSSSNSNNGGSVSGSSSSSGKGSSLQPLSSGGEGEIILPAKMIYTSSGDSTDLMPSENGAGSAGSQNKKRSCCRTQKYSQVIKRDGCEPLTIINKMCFGQCVSVWVPGLFASFPVCRPSKSTFKTVTLTCGKNKEKRKRVRIEKVRRCSCMEIEPTAASL